MFLLYLILWIILNGKCTPEIFLFGILIAGAITALAYRVFDYDLNKERRLLRNIPLLALFLLVLIREIIKAALSVLRMSFSRSKRPDPVIVEFHSGLASNLQNVLLANAITLTPGTYTLFQEDDIFVVHALTKEYADGIEDSVFARLLARIEID